MAAQPVGRLLVGSWVETWMGLARLAGTDWYEDRTGPAAPGGASHGAGDRGLVAATSPRMPEGAHGEDLASRLDEDGMREGSDGPALVARGDASQTPEDVPVTIRVMGNDVGPERLSRVQATSAAHGTVSSNRDGTVTYFPGANFAGVDSFVYRFSAATSWSGWSNVVVTVNPVNDAPTAGADREVVDEDGSVIIDVLNNDQDVDDRTLTVLPKAPTSGTVEVNNDGTLTFRASADFNGDDAFTYRLSDGKSDPAVARVEVKVRPVNDAPTARGDEAITTMGAAVVIDVLNDDEDVDGDALAVTAAQAAHGDVVTNPNGSLTYTPHQGYSGTDEISYAISDGAGGAARAQVVVRVVTTPPGQTGQESTRGG